MTGQPAPFEIVEQDGIKLAANGRIKLTVLDEGGKLFRRRAIKGLSTGGAGEAILPRLNQLAGDLLAQLDMPADELQRRIHELLSIATPPAPQHIEWAVAELNGVRVYVDGETVLVTQRDLQL